MSEVAQGIQYLQRINITFVNTINAVMVTTIFLLISKFLNFDGRHGQDDNMHHITKFDSDR